MEEYSEVSGSKDRTPYSCFTKRDTKRTGGGGIDSLGSLNPKSIVLNSSSYLGRGEYKSEQKSLLASIEDDGDIYEMLKRIIDDSPSSSSHRIATTTRAMAKNLNSGGGHVANLRAITSKNRDYDTDTTSLHTSAILTPKRNKIRYMPSSEEQEEV